MCMFSLGDFLYLFFIIFFAGGRRVFGLLLNGVGGGGDVCATLRLRLRLGIVLGWDILKFKCFWGMFDTYILRKGCEAKWSVDCKPT